HSATLVGGGRDPRPGLPRARQRCVLGDAHRDEAPRGDTGEDVVAADLVTPTSAAAAARPTTSAAPNVLGSSSFTGNHSLSADSVTCRAFPCGAAKNPLHGDLHEML